MERKNKKRNRTCKKAAAAALLALCLCSFFSISAAAQSGSCGLSGWDTNSRPAVGPGADPAGSLSDPWTERDTGALSGGMIRFLKNESTDRQQLAGVVRSSDGKLVVIDGGNSEDAEHLFRVIRENGGCVDAWLITHAHSDHTGGLIEALRTRPEGITVKNVYFCFPDRSWFGQVDPAAAAAYDQLMEQLASFPAEAVHSTLQKGEVIPLSAALSICVLNEPKLSYDSFAVNSSSVMYDITVDGKHLIVLGDMGEQVGKQHLAEGALAGIVCDYVQMAHHGQNGAGFTFYEALRPKSCIWSTPDWLYQAGRNHPQFMTWLTKQWMTDLGVREHYCTAEKDVIIR